MNFEDEPYVRLYVSDTPEWAMMSLEARTVLLHMLKGKFDRAGILSTGKHDPAKVVASVARLPLDFAAKGLGELLENETWKLGQGCLVWPSFNEAQTCKKSDKLRQKESRDKRTQEALGVTDSDGSVTPRDGCATPRDKTSLPVTNGHGESHAVTSGHSYPETEADSEAETETEDAALLVFEFWRKTFNKSARFKLDQKRRKRIDSRRSEGFTVDDLCKAILNAKNDNHLMGRNQNSTAVYDGLQTILRDAAQVERLIDLNAPKALGRRLGVTPIQPAKSGRSPAQFAAELERERIESGQ